MIRTQVYLPKKLYQNIQVLAQQENLPTAEVVRELLTDALTRKRGQTVGQALLQLAAIHASGPTDLSATLDHDLYDETA